MDVGLQLDDTDQVTEYHLDDKKVKERRGRKREEDSKVKKGKMDEDMVCTKRLALVLVLVLVLVLDEDVVLFPALALA